LQYEPHKILYNCSCDKELKKKRGCKRNKRETVTEIACYCDGMNGECEICRGSGKFGIKRCPVKLIDNKINFLLPFFYHWRNTNEYPDKQGLSLQPTKMIDAFNIMWAIVSKREEANKKKA
jgi:hypothetical protein